MEKNVIELHLSNLKLPIIENLIQRQTPAALQEDLDDASTMSQSSLEAIYEFKKSKESDCQNVDNIDEALLSASLRDIKFLLNRQLQTIHERKGIAR